MSSIRIMGTALAIFILTAAAPPARSQADAREDLSPCPGSAPEPSQSAAWSVAFCNRTGHDIVIEFHDNDCPAKDWARRGDVYQRTLRRGESKTLPLCYANEPPGKKPAPGTPAIRIPGGKGVTTTWNVVGDCGDRSKPLSIDARTFYDRGEYKTGIILLQYPSGAAHCAAENGATPTAAVPAPAAAPAAAVAPAAPAPQPPVAYSASPPSRSAAAPVPAPPPPPANPRTTDAPTLSAVIEARDVISRTVQVYAKGGAGYKCTVNLSLTFSDGAGWNDRAQINITATDGDAPIATRKYLKSVTKVQISSNKCERM